MKRVGLVLLVLLLLGASAAYVLRWRILARYPCVFGRWEGRCGLVLSRISDGAPGALRCQLGAPSRTVTFPAGPLQLAADLREPGRNGNGHGIVLLHGSSIYGRRLPLIRILAERLRDRGYTVLTPDLRGFGDSDDPADLNSLAAFDFGSDVDASIEYLEAAAGRPLGSIHVIGHSFGAGAALLAHGRRRYSGKLVLIGPPRRIAERFLAPGAPDSSYFIERAQEDMQLPAQPRAEVWAATFGAMDISRYTRAFAREGHVPLLLVDSEREDPADLAMLAELHDRLSPQVEHWTIPGTDHYLHTGLLLGAPCYSRRALDPFVQQLHSWLQRSP